jgi:hypothetical protein
VTIHENRPGLAWLVLPVVIGPLLRTIWALLVPVELVSDCSIYHTGATQIAAGNGFAFEDGSPNGYWPAGYSAFLSVFYRIFGSSVAVAVTVNVLLSTLFIASTAWLARSLFGSRTAAISAWVVALYPGLIAYTTAVASENLFLPLLTLIALAAVSPRVGFALLGGSAAVALAIAVRPTALLLPALFFIGAFHLGLSWRAGVVRTLAVGALALVFCYPVAERNERIFGEFSYTSFNGGAVLWMGNHDGPPTTDLPEYRSRRRGTQHRPQAGGRRVHPGETAALREALGRTRHHGPVLGDDPDRLEPGPGTGTRPWHGPWGIAPRSWPS